MHDGAEPDPAGSGSEPGTSDGDATRADARGAGVDAESVPRTRRAATRLKERLASSELFAAALGAAPPAAPSEGPGPDRTAVGGASEAAGTAEDVHATRPVPRVEEDQAEEPAAGRDGSARRFPMRRTADPVVEAVPAPSAAPVAVVPVDATGPVPSRGPLRARRVHRVVRRVDPWSVLKLSLLFYFCVWLMFTIAGVLIWGVAVGSGTVESLESFIATLLAFEEFSFNADQIFRLFAMGGLIMVFLFTALSAILAVLFNLISDLIGGIRVTVIEEETTRRIIRRA